MAVGDVHVFPGFLTPVLTQLFFPKPPTTFLTCFCRGERRKYAGKKVHLNRGSKSLPPGHESDTLTTEPPERGLNYMNVLRYFVCLFIITYLFLSHNNPCFQSKIAITNFLVSHACKIRFNDVIGLSTVPMYFYAKIRKHV